MIALEIITGIVSFFSFVGFLLLTSIIPRYRADPKIYSPHATLDEHPALLGKEGYNPVGQKIWFWRNVCLVVFFVDVTFLVLWQQILQ